MAEQVNELAMKEAAPATDAPAPSSPTIVVWAIRAFLAIGALAVVGQIAAMFYAGIGWDGRMDAGQSVVIREVIPELPPGTPLSEAYDKIHFTAEFYGILLPQLGDVLHNAVTGSSGMLTLNDLAAYRWQGFANILITALAAAALGIAAGSALRSRLAGTFAWALASVTPILFGMAYINIKDLPVASGLTMVSAALMLSLTARRRRGRWLVSGIFLTLGGCIGIATRPGLWPVFILLVVGTLVILSVPLTKGGQVRRLVPMAALAPIAGVVTVLFLWWSNPFGRMALFPWMWDSFSVMRTYPWQATIRTAGQDVLSLEPPWWYLPAWLGAQLPLVTLLLTLAGLTLLAGGLLRRSWGCDAQVVLSYVPIVLQGLALPMVIVVSGAVLYDATRHVLFVFPAFVAMAAVVIGWLEHYTPTNDWWPRAAALTGALAVLLSGWATIRWFPYSYAFINPVAGINHPERDWELDYWGVTGFEGVDRLRQENLRYVAVSPSEESSSIFGGASEDLVKSIAADEDYGLYVFKRWSASIGDCESLFTIERDGQVLGEGARCRPSP